MKPVRVTPESMQAAGQQLSAVGEQMASGLTGLGQTIQGSGNPWGADEQGTVFAQLYQAVLGKAFESIDSHVQQVQYAGAGLSAQAQAYSDTETANTSTVTGALGQG